MWNISGFLESHFSLINRGSHKTFASFNPVNGQLYDDEVISGAAAAILQP